MTALPGRAPKDMVWVPGGTFLMGSDLVDYPEEGPPHDATVDGFWADEAPVTVAQFRRFVKATAYVTVAERTPNPADYPDLDPAVLVPGSSVFHPTAAPVDLTNMLNWWRYLPGADWAHPYGPDSSAEQTHPVVHVCWDDVVGYAEWVGKQLPTEAEWERAARGGLANAKYVWGEEFTPKGRPLANTWIGEFPWQNLKPAGRQRTTPVRSYPPNGYGLHDVAGNVWEWTSDFYRAQHAAQRACCGPLENPRVDAEADSHDESEPGGAHVPRRVIKGGSHLCAENYCQRYRPAARQAQQVESPMSHLGFRCIQRP